MRKRESLGKVLNLKIQKIKNLTDTKEQHRNRDGHGWVCYENKRAVQMEGVSVENLSRYIIGLQWTRANRRNDLGVHPPYELLLFSRLQGSIPRSQ